MEDLDKQKKQLKIKEITQKIEILTQEIIEKQNKIKELKNSILELNEKVEIQVEPQPTHKKIPFPRKENDNPLIPDIQIENDEIEKEPKSKKIIVVENQKGLKSYKRFVESLSK